MNTVQLGKEFSMSSGVKKTTEKEIAAGRAHVLSGHDEVGDMDVTTELDGIAKGMVASAAGECDFVWAFGEEGSSNIDLRQQLILPATERKKLQDKDPEKQPGSVVDGEDLAVQEAVTLSKKKQKVYSLRTTSRSVSKWALKCKAFPKETGELADNKARPSHPCIRSKATISRRSCTFAVIRSKSDALRKVFAWHPEGPKLRKYLMRRPLPLVPRLRHPSRSMATCLHWWSSMLG